MLRRFLVLISFLTLANTPFAAGQERTLVGRVTDAVTGEPITSGVVAVQGERIRDAIRPDGVFVLHVPDGPFAVSVRANGYRNQNVEITAEQTTLFVALRPRELVLTPVVSRSGSGDLGNSPTSTSSMTGEGLGEAPKSNLLGGLQGKVPGAEVQRNSGVPGGDFQLTLRGVKTILGSSSPLFVLDGTFVSDVSIHSGATGVTGGQATLPSRIADLNPNDIESIQIIRGAAAATLYGSKGSNGVVVIMTKRGRRS